MSKIEEIQSRLDALGEGRDAERVALLQQLAGEQMEHAETAGDAAGSLLAALALCLQLPEDGRAGLEAGVRYDLARAYSNGESHAEARANAELALELYENGGEHAELAKVQHRLALICILEGNTDTAFERLGEALRLAGENGNADIAADVHATYGDLYSLLQNHSEALENYRLAGRQYEENGNFGSAANACLLLGQLLEKLGRFEQAEQGFLTAAQTYLKAGDHDHAGLCHNQLAKMYDRKSDYADAIGHYRLAAQAFGEGGNEYHVADNLYQAGYMFEEQKQWQNAIGCYEEALPHAQAAEGGEVLADTIADSIENARENLEKEAGRGGKKSGGGGLLGKIKGIFGG